MNTNGALTDNNLDVSNLNEEQLKQVMDIFEAANEEELMASMKEGGEFGEALGGSAAGGGLNIPPTVPVTSLDENGIVEYEVITSPPIARRMDHPLALLCPWPRMHSKPFSLHCLSHQHWMT